MLYCRSCETAGKSGKQIERFVISTFQIAESMAFKGEFRQWENVPGEVKTKEDAAFPFALRWQALQCVGHVTGQKSPRAHLHSFSGPLYACRAHKTCILTERVKSEP